jgi:7-cyano-7-deazaguanine synthase in queuosine biosynthesis
MRGKLTEFSGPGVVVLSGGIDSTVLSHLLARRGLLEHIYFADYGQASASHQWENCVSVTAYKLGVEAYRDEIKLPPFMQGGGHIISGRPGGAMKTPFDALTMDAETYEKVWDPLPGRNTIFLLHAASLAISKGLDTVYVGFQVEPEEWKLLDENEMAMQAADTTPVFVEAFNSLVFSGGIHRNVEVSAPFLDYRWSKSDTVRVASKLGVLEETYSCEFYPPCGVCRQCLDRKRLGVPWKLA